MQEQERALAEKFFQNNPELPRPPKPTKNTPTKTAGGDVTKVAQSAQVTQPVAGPSKKRRAENDDDDFQPGSAAGRKTKRSRT